jgi:hypothetical protein
MDSNIFLWKQVLGTIAFSAWTVATAFAQEPVVIVDIKAIANQLAQNIDAEESQLPLTVQAPIPVATKVCNVPATVLGAQGDSSGAVGCTATTSSPELEKIVRTKIRKEPRTQ